MFLDVSLNSEKFYFFSGRGRHVPKVLPAIAPNGSPYILEVGLFVRSDCGDFLLNSFMDRLGSWRSVFLSNRIMEISCQIASWIALCLGGWSFCRIESWRFPVGFLRLLPSVFWFGQIMDLFCCVASTYPFVFGGGAFCQGVEEFSAETYWVGALWARWSPFCLFSRIFSRIGSWGLVVGSFVGSCTFFWIG